MEIATDTDLDTDFNDKENCDYLPLMRQVGADAAAAIDQRKNRQSQVCIHLIRAFLSIHKK
jgi:hypothetical protein